MEKGRKTFSVWGYSSAGRAPALQAGGQRFDPVYLHQRGAPAGIASGTGRCLKGKARGPMKIRHSRIEAIRFVKCGSFSIGIRVTRRTARELREQRYAQNKIGLNGENRKAGKWAYSSAG